MSKVDLKSSFAYAAQSDCVRSRCGLRTQSDWVANANDALLLLLANVSPLLYHLSYGTYKEKRSYSFTNNSFYECGATRKRNLFPSGRISLLSKSDSTVISSVCSTNDLRCSAQGCVKISLAKIVNYFELLSLLSFNFLISLSKSLSSSSISRLR